MSTGDRHQSEDTLAWSSEGESPSAVDLTGVTLGDFQVERLLGRGGMGEVYLATQLSLNRPVALKVLRADFASNQRYLDRLKLEATAVARLNHPSIVHVYTLGCVDHTNFIAMEFVQGTNLRDYILKKGAIELPLALSIMRQTAQAIGTAGEAGLIHRDIKPENILLTRKGRVKVADFGLCRNLEGNMAITQPGVTMGTPLYMSPEQAQGHAIDHRSDLYSLGVTCYHMLTGEPPFRAENALALALKHVRETPRSMLVHSPELPVELDNLVLKLMAKDPADRYQSAADMLTDLAKIREALQVGSTATYSDASQTDAQETADSPSITTPSRPSPKKSLAGSSSTLKTPAALTQSGSLPQPVVKLRGSLLTLIASACLCVGAVAGWNGRSPAVMAIPADASQGRPGLWLDSAWRAIPKQATAEEQCRFAQIQAPPDQWVAAWLAVPGYFPHSHEPISRAYIQLARILYRRGDLDALSALVAELSKWEESQKRDQELVAMAGVAISARKGDLEAVVEGFKGLTKDDLSDILDPALVELGLEICTDVMAATGSGAQSVARESLQSDQKKLIRRLYRIELSGTVKSRAAGLRR
ncbi:MAG TPA: protein kinase [Isosphaeraceae bacterium]|nr:protein kinase [Isosphaeraceae bacterium]